MKNPVKFLTALVLGVLAMLPQADAQQVEAKLSQYFTRVGAPVQLLINVEGGNAASLPDNIQIEGLDVRYSGKSMQVQLLNGKLTTSAAYTYLIVPLREGQFSIPSLSVRVGNKVVRTKALALDVGAGSGGSVPVRPAIPVPGGQPNQPSAPPQVPSYPPPAPAPQGPPPDDRIVFGELVIPKKSAFVGEVIPVELRFYFSADRSVQVSNRTPSFGGDGFTVMNFSSPTETKQEVDGHLYNVLVYQTAITPAKAGTLEIGSASMQASMQMPMNAPSGADDMSSWFLQQFSQMTDFREVTVSTKPVQLEVKALPREDRPKSFAGAVGQFSLTADASPRKAGPGDPISLKAIVGGRGNFEAMGAPSLIESDGWRSYPPGEKFEPSASDKLGFNGQKTFDYTLVASRDQSLTPAVEFSYFDPTLGKYVTIKTKPVEVEAVGGSAPPAAQTVVATTTTPTPAATATPAPAPSEALAADFSSGTFVPWLTRKPFLVANGALASLWALALVAGLVRRAARSDRARESAVRREARKLLGPLQHPGLEDTAFLNQTAAFLAARLGARESEVFERLEASGLPDETITILREALERHQEARFSPHGVKVRTDERQRILAQLKICDEKLR